MVTPFSQVVGAQAVMNVVNNNRYDTIPDEVIRYILGRFGRPAMKVDANLEDRVRSSPRAKALDSEAGMLPLPELRKRFGASLSDEEFVLRATMPPDQVDAMLAAGPAQRSYDPSTKPTMDLLRGLASRRDVDHISVVTKGVRIEFNNSADLDRNAEASS
jgi:oxaloacetate decarboxylase alpha subunit